jgi:molecular chaperone GrpE
MFRVSLVATKAFSRSKVTVPAYSYAASGLRQFSTTEPPTGAAEPAAEATPAEAVDPTIALHAEIKDLKEKVLRSLAEEENVRRIAKRDVENAHAYANTSFAKAMLEIADDLERASSVVPEDKRKDIQDPILKNLLEGIVMTDRGLHKIFHKFGIVKYGKVDEAFDPHMHDALFQMPDPTKPAGTIGQVVKSGYKLKDRVIRAAQVGTRMDPSA